jgi:hypothetical protein
MRVVKGAFKSSASSLPPLVFVLFAFHYLSLVTVNVIMHLPLST